MLEDANDDKILFTGAREPIVEDSLSFLQGLERPRRPGSGQADILRSVEDWGSKQKMVAWAPLMRVPGGRAPN